MDGFRTMLRLTLRIRIARHDAPLAVANNIFLLMLCSFTNQVLAQLDVLKYWTESTAYKNDPTSCRYSSMRKRRICILLHLVRRLMFQHRNKQIIHVSRFKAPSRVDTMVIELEVSVDWKS